MQSEKNYLDYDYWIKELEESENWIKEYHALAEKMYLKYKGEDDSAQKRKRKFRLFTSNVDLTKAALYSTAPTIEVDRRFKDYDDDVARVAAKILERVGMQGLDSPVSDFDEILKQVIFNRLVPGFGQVWFRLEEKNGLELKMESLYYRDFLWSKCRTWEDRRWVCRISHLSFEELEERFGEEKAKKVYIELQKKEDKINKDTYKVYEIWDKLTHLVIWLSKECDELLDIAQDIYGLESFEPCPKPFFSTVATDECIPIPDYEKAADQYIAADSINARLDNLVKACKLAGVYDSKLKNMSDVLSPRSENKLIPIDNYALFEETGGFKGAISWVPLEQVITAINQLTLALEAKKQQIYELTGISDIIRGATKASETATAQEIKAQYASAKQQDLQKETERFVRDVIYLKIELIRKHLPDEYIIEASNIMNSQDQAFLMPAMNLIRSRIKYRLSIKPFSMAQIDYAREKTERLELITVVGDFISKALPVVSQAPVLAPLAVNMLKIMVSGFKLGKELEGALDEAVKSLQQPAPPQPQGPPPEEVKLMMDQQTHEQRMIHNQELHEQKLRNMEENDDR
jgi:hypothetical protein